jgi:hypothetical protein
MLRAFLALLTLISVSGCSTYAVSRYSNSADNVVALRSLKGKTVNVGPFTAVEAGRREIMCRGVGPIKTPDGETYEEFIQKALAAELKLAEIYSSSAPVTLTGNLNRIDFSSTSGAAWELSLTVLSSNGKSITVDENYKYKSSYYGETACNQTAQALMPAIQDMIGKVVNHPEFAALLQ